METVPKILLAEDNPADVLLVQEALRAAKIECDLRVLNDGALVVDFIEKLDAAGNPSELDLVLLDLHLPKRDGKEILTRLRSTNHLADTPVVVLTGSPVRRDEQPHEKNDAALHYFQKPMSLSGFMEIGVTVREILGRKAGGNQAMA